MFKTGLFSGAVISLFLVLMFCICRNCSGQVIKTKKVLDPFEQNKRLGRGINLGNALDAPSEGEWGVTLKEEYFKIIKDAGFNSVRIPIRWSNHASKEAPYTIDKAFFDRVDWAIENALKNNLYVMINVHHYEELITDPNNNSERFLALWEQISEHYKNYPDSVLFELLNEPRDTLTPELCNDLMKKTLPIVRKTNPYRTLVIEPNITNEPTFTVLLNRLKVPEEDRNIIVSVHYYSPLDFTHQGTPWFGEKSKAWIGTRWMGTEKDKKAITDFIQEVSLWAVKNNRPVNLGEFGVYKDVNQEDRFRWTKFVADTAWQYGFSYHYWEFCAMEFGAYDQKTNQWNYLLDALIPPKK